MKFSQLIIYIILPPILIYLINVFQELPLIYYPITFSSIIGIVNWKKHYFFPVLSILTLVLFSIIAFWISFFSISIIGEIQNWFLGLVNNHDFSGAEIRLENFLISPFIIAPILTFIGYKIIFKCHVNRLTIILLATTIICLYLCNIWSVNPSRLEEDNSFIATIKNPYIIWKILMAFTLQIIIYQNEIKEIYENQRVKI